MSIVGIGNAVFFLIAKIKSKVTSCNSQTILGQFRPSAIAITQYNTILSLHSFGFFFHSNVNVRSLPNTFILNGLLGQGAWNMTIWLLKIIDILSYINVKEISFPKFFRKKKYRIRVKWKFVTSIIIRHSNEKKFMRIIRNRLKNNTNTSEWRSREEEKINSKTLLALCSHFVFIWFLFTFFVDVLYHTFMNAAFFKANWKEKVLMKKATFSFRSLLLFSVYVHKREKFEKE